MRTSKVGARVSRVRARLGSLPIRPPLELRHNRHASIPMGKHPIVVLPDSQFPLREVSKGLKANVRTWAHDSVKGGRTSKNKRGHSWIIGFQNKNRDLYCSAHIRDTFRDLLVPAK